MISFLTAIAALATVQSPQCDTVMSMKEKFRREREIAIEKIKLNLKSQKDIPAALQRPKTLQCGRDKPEEIF